MYNRLYSFLEKHNLLLHKQFGFRSRYSTNHAIISLIELIKKYLENGDFVCGIFIDLQKVFDTVNREILLSKLDHYGIRGFTNDWFHSFLCNRKQYVSCSGYSSEIKEINCGVPQGSTLGPLLFYYTSMIFISRSPNLLFIILQTTRIFFLQIKIY